MNDNATIPARLRAAESINRQLSIQRPLSTPQQLRIYPDSATQHSPRTLPLVVSMLAK
jgi:hypothetical protein